MNIGTDKNNSSIPSPVDLQVSEIRYRRLFESARDGILILDAVTGKITDVNPFMTEFLGYRRDYFLGKELWEIGLLKDKEECIRAFTELQKTGYIRYEDLPLKTKDGKCREVEFVSNVYTEGDDQVIQCNIRDITRRRRIEKERDRFFTLSIDMLCIADLTGFFKRVNPAFEQILGYTAEELLSSPIFTFLHPADRAALIAEYASLATGGPPTTNLENRWRCKDGSYKWVAWSYFPIAEEGIAYGVGRDITRRKLSEEALRESEQRFLALVTASSDVVYRMNPDWSEMSQLHGRNFIADTQEPSGTWLEDYIHPEDQELVRAAIKEAIRTKGNFEMEHQVRRVDGTFGWTHSLAIPLLDRKGEIVEWLGSASDITVRKQAEEESVQLLALTRQAQTAAEGANRMKDEFLATLSHELRTPLNSIVGWASMMANPKFDPVNTPRAVESIRRNGQMQAQMIDDLLDVSSIITGKLRLTVQPVDLAATILAAVEVVRPAAEAKEISLQLKLNSPAGQVTGDPDRLQQILWNLISNAIKFTPTGGRVAIRLEDIESHATITISDTGIGIKSEFLPNVFDRFRQADATSTRSYGGLGLGLAIVRQLVELHGGQVWVESEGAGYGAIFTISLPLAVVSSAELLPDQQRTTLSDFECPPQLEGIRTLVVDDEAETRGLLQFILEHCGSQVKTANSAAAALSAIKEETFDVLVSDIGMPEEDGFALIAKVRALGKEQGGQIPAVALTAYAREEDQKRALDSGYQIHVPKPVEPSELVTIVAKLAEWKVGNSLKSEK